MKTDKKIDKSILQSLVPVSSLNTDELEQLADTTFFETVPAGENLFNEGLSDPWTIFLLSGEVELASRQGTTAQIKSTAAEAKYPLAPAKPRLVTATAKTPVIFIRIADSALEEVINTDSDSMEDLSDEALVKRILHDIQSAQKNNTLIIPTLPDLAEQIRQAVQDPDNDAENIARIIQADPAIAARIVYMSNSPVYRGKSQINTCHAAVSRMGLKATRDAVMSATLQQLFNSESKSTRKLLQELWNTSTHVAAICAVIARLTRRLDEDRAMLAGLLHNIGALPIIVYAEKYPRIATNPELLNDIIDKEGTRVGGAILKRWKFDHDLVTVANECHQWQRDPGPEVDYCDLVILAQLYSALNTPQMELLPRIDTVPAFKKLPLGRLGPKMTLKIIETAAQDIQEIQNMLR